jgi:hypothetical protein
VVAIWFEIIRSRSSSAATVAAVVARGRRCTGFA